MGFIRDFLKSMWGWRREGSASWRNANASVYVRTCLRVYAHVIVSVLQRRLGVPNLALPNGKPGVLAGLLRRPARSLEPSILHLLLQKWYRANGQTQVNQDCQWFVAAGVPRWVRAVSFVAPWYRKRPFRPPDKGVSTRSATTTATTTTTTSTITMATMTTMTTITTMMTMTTTTIS